MTTTVRYAGHSHWQNVKRIKAAKDNEMQKTIHTILRRIRVAVYGWFLQSLNIFDFYLSLADRTNGRAYATVLRLSVCL